MAARSWSRRAAALSRRRALRDARPRRSRAAAAASRGAPARATPRSTVPAVAAARRERGSPGGAGARPKAARASRTATHPTTKPLAAAFVAAIACSWAEAGRAAPTAWGLRGEGGAMGRGAFAREPPPRGVRGAGGDAPWVERRAQCTPRVGDRHGARISGAREGVPAGRCARAVRGPRRGAGGAGGSSRRDCVEERPRSPLPPLGRWTWGRARPGARSGTLTSPESPAARLAVVRGSSGATSGTRRRFRP